MFGAFNSSGGVSLKVRSRSKISSSRRLQFGSGGVSVISSGRKPAGALRIGMHKRICLGWGIRNVWFFQKSQAIYARQPHLGSSRFIIRSNRLFFGTELLKAQVGKIRHRLVKFYQSSACCPLVYEYNRKVLVAAKKSHRPTYSFFSIFSPL